MRKIVVFFINSYKVNFFNLNMAEEYNKLVRDRIPEIIRARGKNPVIHTASNEEYVTKLREKLLEEVNEYLQSNSETELIDILEIVYTLCDVHKITKERIEQMRRKKALERGRFLEKVILEKVE